MVPCCITRANQKNIRPVLINWEMSCRIWSLNCSQNHDALTVSFKMTYHISRLLPYFVIISLKNSSVFWWFLKCSKATSPSVPWRLIAHFVRIGLIYVFTHSIRCSDQHNFSTLKKNVKTTRSVLWLEKPCEQNWLKHDQGLKSFRFPLYTIIFHLTLVYAILS